MSNLNILLKKPWFKLRFKAMLVTTVMIGVGNVLHSCNAFDLILDKMDDLKVKVFNPPFSQTSRFYLCLASQMALLGFYHDSSLFTSPVTSIHAGAGDNRYCEKECTWQEYPRG